VTARHDVYKVPHKAQRRALFLTAIAIGRLNLGDDAAADKLAKGIRQIVAHMRDHSASEDLYIGPLLADLGEAPEALLVGHEEVESLMEAIERELDAGALHRADHEFYLLFNRLVASYIRHMEVEEKIQTDVLWPRYSDEEIIDAQSKFVSSRNPMSSLSDLAFILPSLNIGEICEFLGSIRRDVPEEPFGLLMAVAKKTLEPTVWNAVETRLARW